VAQMNLQGIHKIIIVLNLHLDGAWYPDEAALPARKGKCLASNLSSIQSSIKSLITGVQRDILYFSSEVRSLRGI